VTLHDSLADHENQMDCPALTGPGRAASSRTGRRGPGHWQDTSSRADFQVGLQASSTGRHIVW
jgi:hypothetical protein